MASMSVRLLLDQIKARRFGRPFEPVREIRDFSLIERQVLGPARRRCGSRRRAGLAISFFINTPGGVLVLDISADVFRCGSANKREQSLAGRFAPPERGYIRVERAYDIAELPLTVGRVCPAHDRPQVWGCGPQGTIMLEFLPKDWRDATLVGRILTEDGPTPGWSGAARCSTCRPCADRVAVDQGLAGDGSA